MLLDALHGDIDRLRELMRLEAVVPTLAPPSDARLDAVLSAGIEVGMNRALALSDLLALTPGEAQRLWGTGESDWIARTTDSVRVLDRGALTRRRIHAARSIDPDHDTQYRALTRAGIRAQDGRAVVPVHAEPGALIAAARTELGRDNPAGSPAPLSPWPIRAVPEPVVTDVTAHDPTHREGQEDSPDPTTTDPGGDQCNPWPETDLDTARSNDPELS
ncbi:hypothetical protein IU487_31510 [Nocardia puris]|uniref:Uncharacterized protein n=1 Tax=Nocardia puris TaxID=208602 RepID=A0A366D5J5_9NOCA|nr:hypothetical protein [Nocardia puris]MBF6215525.1 hypothetical protein [Nocardia puris]RBO85311.1 hypothetical protein DFR74_115159 [Nocardia puris]